jgi:hypothetical protein
MNTYTLDLTRDRYLDSHRLGGIPVFPFAMGIEVLHRLTGKNESNTISDYKFLNPIFLRKDRPKTLSIEIKLTERGTICNILNPPNLLHITGNILQNNEDYFVTKIPTPKKQQVKPVLSAELAAFSATLPHGPHFRCDYELYELAENHGKARLWNTIPKISFFENHAWTDVKTNPTLLDGALQLCAFHYRHWTGKNALPVEAASISYNTAVRFIFL